MPAQPDSRSERVLVVAPTGRDGALVEAMLVRVGIEAASVRALSAVLSMIEDGSVGAVLLTEEALQGEGADAFLRQLDAQPAWSDLPILLLSGASAVSREARLGSDALEERANVTLIERPVQTRTLTRAAHAALRARKRQYDMREMLERERESRHQVEAASRAKDEFLATVSHELRTPLNAILGWARLSRDRALPEEKRERAIETIERNAVAQAKLIEDLLDVSRIVSGTLRLSVGRVDLPRVITGAQEVVQPAADAKGVSLVVHADATAGAIMGDAGRLQQVVWNLIANAVKFSAAGSIVEIRLEQDGPDHTVIRVTDQGEGIEPTFLPHVFERFRQADGTSTRTHGGLGLGLSIVRSITELHGGTVVATSAGRQQGSSFVVRLPRAPLASAPRTTTPSDFPVSLVGSLRGLRALIVDDEQDARELVKVLLERLEVEVVAVASVRDALERLARIRPDVIVSDIGMPDEDGYSLIRAIRSLPEEQGGRVPAVALTAYARASDRTRALQAGFDEHVVKPVDLHTLVAVVTHLTRRQARPEPRRVS